MTQVQENLGRPDLLALKAPKSDTNLNIRPLQSVFTFGLEHRVLALDGEPGNRHGNLFSASIERKGTEYRTKKTKDR